MFIVSLKSMRGKLVLLVLIIAVAATVAIYCMKNSNDNAVEDNTTVDGTINYSAANEEERIKFIKQFGWTVKSEPESVTEVLIPAEFDEVYSNYNDIQETQGLNLSPYKGCVVKKWVYIVTNYQDYEEKDCIHITLLIYKNKVIAGDVCSTEIDGFMHGFAKQ